MNIIKWYITTSHIIRWYMQILFVTTAMGSSFIGMPAPDERSLSPGDERRENQLIQNIFSAPSDENEYKNRRAAAVASRTELEVKARERTKRWIAGIAAGIISIALFGGLIYAFYRPPPVPVYDNLNEVISSASFQITGRPDALKSKEVICLGAKAFPTLEENFTHMKGAVSKIHELEPHTDLEGLIAKLEHIVDFFGQQEVRSLNQREGILAYLNKELEGDFTLEDKGDFSVFEISQQGGKKKYLLRRATFPTAKSIFRTSMIVGATETMKHVARIYHVFEYGKPKDPNSRSATLDVHHRWYLEEHLGSFTPPVDIDIDFIRRLTRDVILGLKELHKYKIGHYELGNLHNIGTARVLDDDGEMNYLYKIAGVSTLVPVKDITNPSDRAEVGKMLLRLNDGLAATRPLTAAANVGPQSDNMYGFYGVFGECLECLDFILWCFEKPGTPGNRVTWDNVLVRHPLFTRHGMSAASKQIGRLKGVKFFD